MTDPVLYEQFVAHFQAAWSASDPRMHDALWTDDVELHQPVLGSLYGREACRAAFDRMFRLAPDLTLTVHSWSERDGILSIAFTFHTRVGGADLRWPAVDVFRLDDAGRVVRRDSYWDPLPVLLHLARHPRAWPAAVRARMLPRTQDRSVQPLA